MHRRGCRSEPESVRDLLKRTRYLLPALLIKKIGLEPQMMCLHTALFTVWSLHGDNLLHAKLKVVIH